ncbi:hypothetical protein C8Q76DRAFT_792748 [Earliella scabrosa]|nr:hypothetical protein C8Q76DRAFT_792748 [Earliella scabrosa]
MSGPPTSDDAAVIFLIDSIRLANYCAFAALTFIFLEYLFTFHQEVELYWRRKFTGASGLFFVNRYLLISLTIIQIYGFFPMSDKRQVNSGVRRIPAQDADPRGSCTIYAPFANVVNYLQYIPWAVFAAMRGYALTRSLIVALVLFLLSSVTLVLNFITFAFGLTGVNQIIDGCTSTATLTADMAKRQSQSLYIADTKETCTATVSVAVTSRTCLTAADVMLIVITWQATFRSIKVSHLGGEDQRPSFAGVLLRDEQITDATTQI